MLALFCCTLWILSPYIFFHPNHLPACLPSCPINQPINQLTGITETNNNNVDHNISIEEGNQSKIATTLSSASSQLHDEFLQLVQTSGIEKFAKEAGIIQNGEIPVFREYACKSKVEREKGRDRKNMYIHVFVIVKLYADCVPNDIYVIWCEQTSKCTLSWFFSYYIKAVQGVSDSMPREDFEESSQQPRSSSTFVENRNTRKRKVDSSKQQQQSHYNQWMIHYFLFINQSINWSINRSFVRSSFDQSINQSINQSIMNNNNNDDFVVVIGNGYISRIFRYGWKWKFFLWPWNFDRLS